MKSTELVDCLLDGYLDILFLCDVTVIEEKILILRLLSQPFPLHISHRNPAPLFQKMPCGRLTQPRSPARYENNKIFVDFHLKMFVFYEFILIFINN